MLSADTPVLVMTDIPPHHAPTRDHPIRIRSRPMPAGHGFAGHTHPWAQLAYSSRGVLRMTSMSTTWIVPPNVPHQVEVIEDAFLRTIYIDESACPVGPSGCQVVEVSPLMHEVIAALDARQLPGRREALLCELLQDEMMRSRPLPLGVPLPTEKRLRELCEAVLADPAHAQTLESIHSRAWPISSATRARVPSRRCFVAHSARAPVRSSRGRTVRPVRARRRSSNLTRWPADQLDLAAGTVADNLKGYLIYRRRAESIQR